MHGYINSIKANAQKSSIIKKSPSIDLAKGWVMLLHFLSQEVKPVDESKWLPLSLLYML